MWPPASPLSPPQWLTVAHRATPISQLQLSWRTPIVDGQAAGQVSSWVWGCCLGDVRPCRTALWLQHHSPSHKLPPHPAPSISHISRTSAATLSQKPAITGELKTEEPLLELWNTVLGLPPPRRLPLLVDLYPFSQGLDIFSALGAPSCGFKALS